MAGNILREWKQTHRESVKEIERLDRRISSGNKALERYLKAFELRRLSESACSARVRAIEKELAVFEAEKATLQAAEPAEFSEDFLEDLRSQILEAVENGSPQRVKRLLGTVVHSIEVESRDYVQPYFNVVPVRTPFPSRRRTVRREDNSVAGPSLAL